MVIPTRDRCASLLRLLDSLERQSLDAASFEVVVVDDGTVPPLEATVLGKSRPYALRVLRRDRDHGAHESRLAGASAAKGDRVLFLDDDVEPAPEVLALHAAVRDGYAVGPIYYPADANRSPFLRYKAGRYAAYARRLLDKGPEAPITEAYLCNASGPTDRFTRALLCARELYGADPLPGTGLDEEFTVCELGRTEQRGVTVLAGATIWHRDDKTIQQARLDYRRLGMAHGHILLHRADLRAHYATTAPIAPHLGWYRAARGIAGDRGVIAALRLRLFWAVPALFHGLGALLTWIASVPAFRWVPARVCQVATGIDYWEGVRSVAPSYRVLRAALAPSDSSAVESRPGAARAPHLR